MSSKKIVFAVLLGVAFGAQAAKTTVEEIIELSEQAQITELQSKASGVKAGGGASVVVAPMPLPPLSSKARDSDEFRVIAIYGVGKSLRAEIMFSKDSSVTVITKGQRVFGWSIDAIEPYMVKATKTDEKGKTTTFMSEVQSSGWPAVPATVTSGLPPLPGGAAVPPAIR